MRTLVLSESEDLADLVEDKDGYQRVVKNGTVYWPITIGTSIGYSQMPPGDNDFVVSSSGVERTTFLSVSLGPR